jgi:VanZ family protein
VFDAVFSPDWVHVVMHFVLFAGLTVLLFPALFPRFGFKSLAMVLLIGLAVGIFQEGFQALSLQSGSLSAAIFDLGVDLAGSLTSSMGCIALNYSHFKQSN